MKKLLIAALLLAAGSAAGQAKPATTKPPIVRGMLALDAKNGFRNYKFGTPIERIPGLRPLDAPPWAELEGYTRDQVKQGKEAYIISGGYGQKGVLAKGKVAIPANTWKVIVFTDKNAGGAAGVTNQTRTIAINMPNEEGIKTTSWKQYLTTIRDLEGTTGYDFLKMVPQTVQDQVELVRDRG